MVKGDAAFALAGSAHVVEGEMTTAFVEHAYIEPEAGSAWMAGETLVISAAAGAVGSIAGQVAKARGCRVIGIAGGADKCRWLTEELGYPETELAMRRHLFRVAAKHQLLDDPQTWMDFHQARNLTSHTYNLAIAEQVAQAAGGFAHTGHALLNRLQQAAQDAPPA